MLTMMVLRMAGHRFVDRIIDDFVDEVVQAARRGVADVHAGTFANVFYVIENLNCAFVIVGVLGVTFVSVSLISSAMKTTPLWRSFRGKSR